MLPALIAIAMFAAGQDAAATPVEPKAPQTEVSPATVQGEKLRYGVVEGRKVEKTGKVCFNDAASGSKIPTKRCMDREEFKIRQREQQEYLGRFQREVSLPQ